MMARHADPALRERLLRDLPVERRRIDVGGLSTFVVEGGEGPPVLLLHGGIESGGACWGPAIARLARTCRLVVPDVPGLGESDPVARLDPARIGEWLAELIGLTCRERPTLVAHSLLGGPVARLVARRGDLVGRLVIVGAPAIGPYRMPPGLLATAIRFGARPSDRNFRRFAPWAFHDPGRTRDLDPGWYDAFFAYGASRGTVPHVKRTMRQVILAGKRRVPDEALRRIAIPTTLLWGRHDRFVPLRLAQGTSARLGWPLDVIEGSGHLPFVERLEPFMEALEGASIPVDASTTQEEDR
jgi:pimeloyl-ACP methyl ester carboxylesterase